MPRGLFITGTGTGVGKTFVAALIAEELTRLGQRVGVYKPVASGCMVRNGSLVSEDAQQLWNAAGRPGDLEQVCPQCFAAPLAPHLAARAEGKRVDARLLRAGLEYWQAHSDVVLVEGAGGLMSPIGDDDFNADLAHDFGYPLLVVSANELGAINHTLQTLIAASTYGDGLDVAGIILNQPRPLPDDASLTSNRDELARLCAPPVLASLAFGAKSFAEKIDWPELMGS